LLKNRYTFTSGVTLVAVYVLCLSLLLQPVVYAQEPDVVAAVIEAQAVACSALADSCAGCHTIDETLVRGSAPLQQQIRMLRFISP
jgi:hypothetical protein